MTIYLVVLLAVLNQAGFNGSRVAVSLHALELGASQFTVGVIMALFALVPMLIGVRAGRWLDAVGPWRPTVMGALLILGGTLLPALFAYATADVAPLLVAAAMAYPSYKRAYLLSSGSSLLFEPGARMRSLVLITLSLLSACLAVWHVHLALVGAPRHKLSELLDRAAPRRRTPLYLLFAGLGAFALFQFSELVSRELRAYLFLSEFLLPLAFLFAASLLYALQRRAAGWLSIIFGLAIASALIAIAINLFVPMRVTEDEEQQGLDITSHGERAWEFD